MPNRALIYLSATVVAALRLTNAAEAQDSSSGGADCHPSYEGACVPITTDVDCIGGSGNGPAYVGRVIVVGPDVYELDRDGDGIACDAD